MIRVVAWAVTGALTVAGLVIFTVTPDGLNPIVGFALIMAAVGIASAIPTPVRSQHRRLDDQRDVNLEFAKIAARLTEEDQP